MTSLACLNDINPVLKIFCETARVRVGKMLLFTEGLLDFLHQLTFSLALVLTAPFRLGLSSAGCRF